MQGALTSAHTSHWSAWPLTWLNAARECLEDAGLKLDGELKGPILRAPANSYGDALCLREVRSNEITLFIRKILQPVSSKDRLACVSSHSLKRTLLSWAAKFGLTDDVCSVLGRHTSATVSSRALYALDLATAPARELQRMTLEVAAKRFGPDAARSEYFPLRTQALEPDAPTLREQEQAAHRSGLEVKVETTSVSGSHADPAGPICVDSEPESSSSESSSSESSDSGEGSPKRPSKVPRLDVDWPQSEIAVHVKSHIAHRIVFTSEGEPWCSLVDAQDRQILRSSKVPERLWHFAKHVGKPTSRLRNAAQTTALWLRSPSEGKEKSGVRVMPEVSVRAGLK